MLTNQRPQPKQLETSLFGPTDFPQMRLRLHQINQIITQIENGQYGLCHDCGQNIAPARLAFIPLAERCIHCQRSKESETCTR